MNPGAFILRIRFNGLLDFYLSHQNHVDANLGLYHELKAVVLAKFGVVKPLNFQNVYESGTHSFSAKPKIVVT